MKADSKARTYPIFLGTEWRFTAEDVNSFQKALDSLSAISAKYPGVLFMPGSIAWSVEFKKNQRLAFNSLPIFLDGKLVHLYHKEHPAGDIETLVSFFNNEQSQYHWATNYAEPGYPIKDMLDHYNSHIFTVNNLVMSVEICNDHVHGCAKNDYEKEHFQGSGLDLQIVTAHGTRPVNSHLRVSPNGAFAYMDFSHDAKTQLSNVASSMDSTSQIKAIHSNENKNTSLIGGLKTEIASKEISSSLKGFDMSWSVKEGQDKGIASLFKAFERELSNSLLNLSEKDIRQTLIVHLKNNSDHYYPNSSFIPSNSLDFTSEQFFRDIQRRYTFKDEQEFNNFILLLQNDKKSDLEPYSSLLLQLMSEVFRTDIVLHQDMASAPTKYYSSKGYVKSDLSTRTIHLAISHKNQQYMNIDLRKTEKYLNLFQSNQKSLNTMFNLKATSKEIEEANAHLQKALDELTKTTISEEEREFVRYIKESQEFQRALKVLTVLDGLSESNRFLGSYLTIEKDGAIHSSSSPMKNQSHLDTIYSKVYDSVLTLLHSTPSEQFEVLQERLSLGLQKLATNYSLSVNSNYQQLGTQFQALQEMVGKMQKLSRGGEELD